MAKHCGMMTKIKNYNGEVSMKMKAIQSQVSSGWLAKVSRVLIFTMLFSAIIGQGWYSPKPAEAAMAGQMKLYFHKEPSDRNETYNSLSFTPPEPAADTTSTLVSTTNVNATPPTAMCESTDSTGETFNRINANSTPTGNRCMGTFISPPVGQAISIATTDTGAIEANIWIVDSVTAIVAPLNIYLYKWDGATLTRFKTLTSTTDPGTTVTSVAFAAVAPDVTVSFAATDRIVAIVSRNITTAATGNLGILFDSTARDASSITLKYTAITPSKPTLSGGLDDDFTISGSAACSTSGVAYNTKWTCLQGTTANTAGAFNSASNSSEWLWLNNQITNTAVVRSHFGTTPSNTYIYQTLPASYKDGVVETVVNSTLAYTIGAGNPTTPFSHAGLVLWTSNTDYLEVQVYSTGAKGAVNTTYVALNNSGTLSSATSLNATVSSGVYNRVWLGFTKTGNNYQPRYSTDGTTWTNLGTAVAHATAFTSMGLDVFTGLSNPVNTYAGAFEWFRTTMVPAFSFSASNYSQNELNAGTSTVTVTVNRTGNTSGTDTVQYATSNGTARTADNDYVAASGTLTFTTGVTSQTFTVTINGDTKYEYNEKINLALSSPSAGSVLGSPSTATITITNDDAAPTVGFNSSASTGSELNGKVTIPVSLSEASGKTAKVTYYTTDATATSPADFTAVSNGLLTFLPGEVTKYFTITIINDAPTADPGQTFTVTLSSPVNANPGATMNNTVTITEKWESTSTSCGSCHAYPPLDGTRSGATGSVVGSHQSHPPVCLKCHVVPTTQASADYGHRNGNIQMQPGATGIDGGYYDKNNSGTFTASDESFTQTNSPATARCSSVACHGSSVITPTWGVGTLDCLGCHNITMGTRREVVSEFSRTWSHKRSSTSNPKVNAFDCGVCHMEGSITGSVTTGNVDFEYHGNGTIELRDPDTGKTIEGVIFSGDSTTSGNFTSNGSSLSFERFSRKLDVTLESDPEFGTIAAIQINHCLKCHDDNGAAVWAPGGSALQPFAVAITGHVAPYDSNGNGNVVDVKKSFITTNSSYHPVRGRQNNSYTQGAMMVAPWTLSKTTGTTTQYGNLMSCWDCHAPSGISSSETLTMTVTAHGALTTLRGGIRAAGTTGTTNLCLNCHVTTYATTGTRHPAGSAFGTSGGNSAMAAATFSNCSYCHAYGPSGGAHLATSTARPLRAEDAHGFNDRTAGTVGSLWGTSNVRPYAFIRNILTEWSPTSAPEGTPTHTCTGGSAGNPCNNNMSNSSYTPGGAY